MPSPFPGMDPYLEHPDRFPGLHDSLIFLACETLNAVLQRPYYARNRSRIWIEESRRPIYPDVDVIRRATGKKKSLNGGVAVAPERRARPIVVTVYECERSEPFVEIYAKRGAERRLVTSIEILSPSNKTPGNHGRDLYFQKQEELLNSKANLVEIDLLRGGKHTTAVPLDLAVEKAGRFDYHVCVHRFDRRLEFLIYPFQLADSLPFISIPLLPGDPEVEIDVQQILKRAYDMAGYAQDVDYGVEKIVPALSPKQARWATRLLREKGLMPAS